MEKKEEKKKPSDKLGRNICFDQEWEYFVLDVCL